MTSTLLLDSSENSSRTLRLNKLMQKVFSVMNLSVDDDTTVEIAENNMDNIVHQVRRYKSTILGKNTVDDDDDDDENIILEISSTPVLDPPRLRQKGKTYGRLKGFLQKRKKKKSSKADACTSRMPQSGTTMSGIISYRNER
ncbi:unnamed protein product [Ilex paraguariensis]|uniref:Uncharacterized protein n=1 Tax=Ilex paraguariensis TaxID=185542 RepID=A0ABC8U9T4_9AQUA